jgi:cell wall-associated NlpC family hydrolase
MTPAEFIAFAETWIGVPYAHQGRSRVGVDCAGLPVAVLREAGALPPDFRERLNYSRHPAEEMIEQLERWCTRLDQVKNGCLVHIQWPRQNLPSHLAIIADGDVIHSFQKAGGVVRHPYRGAWVKMTVGLWTAPGVSYE